MVYVTMTVVDYNNLLFDCLINPLVDELLPSKRVIVITKSNKTANSLTTFHNSVTHFIHIIILFPNSGFSVEQI